MLRSLAVLLCLPIAALAQTTGEPAAAIERARKELEPRFVKLPADPLPFHEALKVLQEQTGNTLADRRRSHKDNPKLKFDSKEVSFWQALDDITGKARCGYSLYQDDGKLALVDGPARKLNTAYAGICRMSVKRVTAIRDEESGQRFCNVLVELTWEPRFQPIYVVVGTVEAVFAGKMPPVKVNGPGQTLVEGQAVEFELRLPAPPRTCPSIESLSVPVKLIGPAKMLTFRLGNLNPVKDGVEQVQDDVKVVFKPLTPLPDRWSFDVTIFNPPGVKLFESHEHRDWLTHNRIYLEKADGGRTSIIRHKPEDEAPAPGDSGRFSRVAIRYEFTNESLDNKGVSIKNLPANMAGWALVYRTPGRIVDLPLRFVLKNIPLP